MAWIRRIGRSHVAWQMVVGAAVLVVCGLLLRVLLSALTPLVIALMLAFAMAPLVKRLERLRLPHILAIITAFVLTLGAIAGFLIWLIPSVVHELARFQARFADSLIELRGRIDPLLARFGTRLPQSVGDLTGRLGKSMQELVGVAGSAMGGVATGALAIGSSLVNILLVPFLTFYALKDGDEIREYLHAMIPPRFRPYLLSLFRDINSTLGGFIRGQLTVMLLLSALYSLGLTLVGVELAVVVGVVTGMIAFVPYIGLAVGLSLALLMAGLSPKGATAVVGVLVVYGGVGLADGMFITPRIVGGKVGLSPPAVIIALLIFGALFGFYGVLVAVPGAAVFKIVLGRLVTAYHHSAFYTRGDPARDPVALELLATPAPQGPVVTSAVPGEGPPRKAAASE
jgi:predicted PurR-regulated permease PerM